MQNCIPALTILAVIVVLLVLVRCFYMNRQPVYTETLGGGGRGGMGGGRGGMGGGRGGGGGGRGGGGGGRGGMGGGRGGMGGGGGWWPWSGRGWGGWWPWSGGWDGGLYPEYTYPVTYYEEQPQSFTVRIGPKGDRHPFAGQGSKLGYMITSGGGGLGGCGTSGARLDLEYGQTYEFNVYTGTDCVTGQSRDQPFFFTTDPKGGSRAGEIFNINPTVNGTIRITITSNLPREFYYQSTADTLVGGFVVLH